MSKELKIKYILAIAVLVVNTVAVLTIKEFYETNYNITAFIPSLFLLGWNGRDGYLLYPLEKMYTWMQHLLDL